MFVQTMDAYRHSLVQGATWEIWSKLFGVNGGASRIRGKVGGGAGMCIRVVSGRLKIG